MTDIGSIEYEKESNNISLLNIVNEKAVYGSNTFMVTVLNEGNLNLTAQSICLEYSVDSGKTWKGNQTVQLNELKGRYDEQIVSFNLKHLKKDFLVIPLCVRIVPTCRLPLDTIYQYETICKDLCVGLEKGNYELFMNSLHKNLVHYYLLAHHALPYLKKSKGSIVNINSKTAETGQGGTSAYAAANGGRNALTREWAVELLPFGIRVNAVVVAECFTPLYEKWLQALPNPEEKLKSIKAKIPLGQRFTTKEEIANTVAFLLSEKSSHTTGQLIHVDGGYVHLDRAL